MTELRENAYSLDEAVTLNGFEGETSHNSIHSPPLDYFCLLMAAHVILHRTIPRTQPSAKTSMPSITQRLVTGLT